MFRADAGITSEVPIEVQVSDAVTSLEVVFIGCMADIMKHVAKHGKRIGSNRCKALMYSQRLEA